jgi:hypothetical protein
MIDHSQYKNGDLQKWGCHRFFKDLSKICHGNTPNAIQRPFETQPVIKSVVFPMKQVHA